MPYARFLSPIRRGRGLLDNKTTMLELTELLHAPHPQGTAHHYLQNRARTWRMGPKEEEETAKRGMRTRDGGLQSFLNGMFRN